MLAVETVDSNELCDQYCIEPLSQCSPRFTFDSSWEVDDGNFANGRPLYGCDQIADAMEVALLGVQQSGDSI